MNKAAPGTFFAKDGRGCVVSHVERRFWQERRHRLGFLEDLRRALVGDSKNERTCVYARRFLLAPGENRRAGSVGNRKCVAEILFPISQSVECQEMKRTVGHDNKVLALEKWAQRCDKFAVESFQMTMRGTQKRFRKSLDIFVAHAKLGELKSQQLQKMSYPGEHRHGQNPDFLAGDDGGYEAFAGRKVFDKGGVLGKMGLQLCEGKIRGSFQSGVLPFVRRKLAQSSHQLFLLRLSLFLQTPESLVGLFFGTKLLELDAVVVPVEFLAQVSDSADKIALPRFTQRKTLSALKYHFDHAA